MIKLLVIYIASSSFSLCTDKIQDVSFRESVVHIAVATVSTATVFKPLVLDADSKAYMMNPTFNQCTRLNWIPEEEVCSGKRREA
jgi:hypothetical protein